VLLTKRVAVEATAIIAQEKRDELIQRHGLTSAYVDRCADFVYNPGISVVRAAQIAASAAPIHAMHDPTEGGLASGLWELAAAAGVGLEIDSQAVPIYPETRALCDAYGLDPWGVIASGSLLLTLDPSDAGPVCDALGEAGIETTVIGRVLPRESGVTTRGGQALPGFARDEIARLFE
jgi:hydrogenase maturation factor